MNLEQVTADSKFESHYFRGRRLDHPLPKLNLFRLINQNQSNIKLGEVGDGIGLALLSLALAFALATCIGLFNTRWVIITHAYVEANMLEIQNNLWSGSFAQTLAFYLPFGVIGALRQDKRRTWSSFATAVVVGVVSALLPMAALPVLDHVPHNAATSWAIIIGFFALYYLRYGWFSFVVKSASEQGLGLFEAAKESCRISAGHSIPIALCALLAQAVTGLACILPAAAFAGVPQEVGSIFFVVILSVIPASTYHWHYVNLDSMYSVLKERVTDQDGQGFPLQAAK